MFTLAVIFAAAFANMFGLQSVSIPVYPCGDDVAVHVAADGSIYGDANHDGWLSGTECDWR